MMESIKAYMAGVVSAALVAVSLFAGGLYNGTIQRGESIHDISDMLPPVVREMPVRKAARDDVGRMLGGG